MEKPVILTVDDEPQVLNAIERDLQQHYGERYRILKAGSGAEALALVERLHVRNTAVALFLADQRMPGMSGTEFILAARQFYPAARKVLLTAYADTQVAIDSINRVGLDHYMLKPWHPPEQQLYPVLDAVLGDWRTAHTYGGWTDAFLDSKRRMGDPLADGAAQELFATGTISAVNELMRNLVHNDDLVPETLAPVIRHFLTQTDGLPAWTDRAKLVRAQQIFARYAPTIVTILYCYALPAAYSARKGVRVLQMTSYMQRNPRRRIIETAQFLLDVMAPGGLDANGHGLRSAQKVRLMHAAIRVLASQRPGWLGSDETPINQEDLVGTLLTFGAVTIEGMQRLGIGLSEADVDAYLHLWNVVGHVMGIHYDLLPRTATEAANLARAIQKRQWGSSPEGQELTRSLITHIEEMIPGTLFDGLASSLIRFYIGDETANTLAVPAADWTQNLVKLMKYFSWLQSNATNQLPLLGRLSEVMGRKLLEGLFWCERGGERVPFHVPATLHASWELDLPMRTTSQFVEEV